MHFNGIFYALSAAFFFGLIPTLTKIMRNFPVQRFSTDFAVKNTKDFGGPLLRDKFLTPVLSFEQLTNQDIDNFMKSTRVFSHFFDVKTLHAQGVLFTV